MEKVAAPRLGLFVLVCMAVLGARPASAQEFRKLGLNHWEGYLELGLESERETRTRDDVETSFGTEELELQQRLGLSMDGYFFHPAVVTYLAAGEVAFTQKEISGMGDEERSSEKTLLGGELRFTFLDGHYYGFSFFGSRKETDFDASFQPGHVVLNDTLGASFRFSKGPIPFQIAYSHHTTRGSAQAGDANETTDDLTIRGQYRIGDRSRGDIEYRFNDSRQTAFDRRVTTHRLKLSNATRFGARGEKRLHGRFRFRSQSGSVEISSFAFQETFDWEITENLSTLHSLSFDRTEANGTAVDILNAKSSLSHELYGSLLSRLEVGAGLEESAFGKRTRYRANIAENYSRRLRGWGHLSLGVSVFAEVLDQDVAQDSESVRDESVTFDGLAPVSLGQLDVVPGTVLLTDERGLTLYVPIRDYLIRTSGRITQILRSPLGQIPEGGTVFVSYTYEPAPPGTLLSTGMGLSGRFAYRDSLSFYARYRRMRQDLLSGFSDADLEWTDRWTVGGRAKWRWISGGIEFETQDSSQNPIASLSEWVAVSGSFLRRVKGQLTSSHTTIVYTDSEEEMDMLDLYGSASVSLTRRSRFMLDANYRRQRWAGADGQNDLDAYDVRAGYVWRYRKVSAEANARFSVLDQRGDKEEVNEFSIIIRRDF